MYDETNSKILFLKICIFKFLFEFFGQYATTVRIFIILHKNLIMNRTIAVVNILFGNRPGAGFEINHRPYCLRTNKKKIMFPFLHEKSNTLRKEISFFSFFVRR